MDDGEVGDEGKEGLEDLELDVDALGHTVVHRLDSNRSIDGTSFMLMTNSESDIRGTVRTRARVGGQSKSWALRRLVSHPYCNTTSPFSSQGVHEIPAPNLNQPPWLNETKVTEELKMTGILRGSSISYGSSLLLPMCLRHLSRYHNINMCRFNSGVPPLTHV